MWSRVVPTSLIAILMIGAAVVAAPSSAIATTVTQVGVTLEGTSAGDEFGSHLAFSSDGTVLAVSAPKASASPAAPGQIQVFREVSGSWESLGNSPVVGGAATDLFGSALALSADGRTLAVGAPGDNSGQGEVSVYALDSDTNQWALVDVALTGTAGNQQFGSSVALDDTGTILAVGARYHEGANGVMSGTVQVYSLVTGSWTARGSRLDGLAIMDYFGSSVSLSSNGVTLAVGATGRDVGGTNSGQVVVYTYNPDTTQWAQRGSVLDGSIAGEASGSAVSLSGEGNTVVVGSPSYTDGDAANLGALRTYGFVDLEWALRGQALVGGAAGDKLGTSVAVSDSGSRVLAGGVGGQVVVRDFSDAGQYVDSTPFISFSPAGGTARSAAISASDQRVAVGAPLSSTSGTTSGSVAVFDLVVETSPPPAESAGLPGIYLHNAGPLGRAVEGSPVYLGAYRVMSGSQVTLTLRSTSGTPTSTVLSTLVVNQHGSVHERIVLGSQPAGDYTLILRGTHASGTGLMLTHRFSVGPDGHISALADNLPSIW